MKTPLKIAPTMKVIDLGRDFARLPFGRVKKDGTNNATRFRDEFLIPATKSFSKVRVIFDNARGLGSSFLEESFGILVEELSWTKEDFNRHFEIVSENDPTLIDDTLHYVAIHARK